MTRSVDRAERAADGSDVGRWQPPSSKPPFRRRAARWVVRVGALLAGLLIAAAAMTQVLARRAEETYPALGESVVVSGLQQHVLVRGQGPPVVFVHGAYGGLQDFAATILAEASTRFQCVLWDRPGHGYSERPEGLVDPGVQGQLLIDLVHELELERPLLVGFSFGGAVCLAAALAAPDDVRGVVLINGPSHPWPEPLALEYRLGGVPLLGWLLSETVVAPLGSWLGAEKIEEVFAPLPVPTLFERSPVPLALRPESYRANTQDMRLLKPFLRRQVGRYRELTTPVTALVATGDRVVNPALHAPQLIEVAASVRMHQIDAAGHQLLYTHPELVLETIARALDEDRR